MWEQVKRAMVKSARLLCRSLRVEGKNPKNVRRNDEEKAAVRRNEAIWKEVLAKERSMEAYREERRTVKKCLY